MPPKSRVIAVGKIKRRPVSTRLPRGNVVVAQAGLGSVETKGRVVCIMQDTSGGSIPVPTLPANRLLTEADESIMQENSNYLLLDIG